jgi:branched-chain amino acid transport system permease protein
MNIVLSLRAPSPKRVRFAEIGFWFAVLAAAALLPDRLMLLSQILILGLFAVSLDLALGYAGILTVGHAAFFGIGACAAGLLGHRSAGLRLPP